MQTILIILGVLYVVAGLVVYFLTMGKSDALRYTINNYSPVNTFSYTNKWLWLLIVLLWPVWLFIQEKLPNEGKERPF